MPSLLFLPFLFVIPVGNLLLCLLARNPYIGRRRYDDLLPGLRSFPVGDYIIFYCIEVGDVRILHVVRGSRNTQALFGQ